MGNYKNSTSKGKTNSENSKFDKMQSKLKPAPQASLEKAMIEEESLNQTAEAEEIKMTEPLEIGDECQVKWRDGSKKLAKIIERRPLNSRKRKKRNGSDLISNSNEGVTDKQSFSKLKPDQVEYYVHLIDYDRRLDEWIKLSQFDLSTLDKSKRVNLNNGNSSNEHTPHSRRSRRERRKNNSANYDNTGSHSHHRSGGNLVDQSLAAFEREHEEITKVKNISKIILGKYEVCAWYFSPFPEEYSQEECLFVCEFCLTYCKNVRTYRRHKCNCAWRTPPGDEIYREKDLSVFEVDGKEHRVYCQNLCLLAKLFLDHKTLYYDVEPFIFYIITHVDAEGAHIVGYFSKEKVSAEDYNLACILTFPQYQKHGYGKFIISLSYELSKRERKTGSPEKPLSDLGKISYRSYWTYILMSLLAEADNRKSLGIREIAQITAIKTEDIISTLQSLNMIKFWKGQHVIFVQEKALRDFMSHRKPIRLCKSECLTWDPHSERKKEA